MRSAELLRKLKKVADRRGETLVVKPAKGSHHKVSMGGFFTVIPIHNAEVKRGTLKGILKNLHVTEEEL